MEAQGSIWSAPERKVIANMENYLDKSDDVKLELGELEPLMGPEDLEVDLMYILTHARRRRSRIFEIFISKEKSDHLVASRNRRLQYQGQRVAQQERSQSDLSWTKACEGIAKRWFKNWGDSEITKVSTRELEEQVLSPNEPRINVVRIARPARNEKKEQLFQIFRHRDGEVLIASKARWDVQLNGSG